MDTLRERKLLRLVDHGSSLSPAECSAYLDLECIDDRELRDEVERMLATEAPSWGLGADRFGQELREFVARASWQARPGEVVGGFRLGREIGSGGMGAVFEAVQDDPRRHVALKLLHGHLVGTDAAQRFAIESEILARLNHPNVAQVLRSGTHEVEPGILVPWFAMELIEGARTLTRHARDHALRLPERLRLLITVCDAVHHGHQQGVIHRDLKPANVLVDAQGRVKVIDFGIAATTNRAEALTLLTQTGDLLGTLPYMSPEQVSGPRRNVDTRTDVYALGVLLFELITDRLPIELDDLPLAESVRRVTEQPCRRPSALRSDLSRELDWIALRALEKDPARRYPSASELQADVLRHLAGESIQAGQPSVAYATVKAMRRHPVVSSVAGLLLVGSAAFGSYQSHVVHQARVGQTQAHVLAAAIAAEQGHWGSVVDSLDQALALEVGDPVALGLQRLSALIALGEYENAAAALATLERHPRSADHVGPLLYFGGLLELAEKDQRESGLLLLETAIDHSLPPADAAFARGMTAATSVAAIAAFREALALDAAHPLAWSGLLNALIASGQLREARRTLDSLRMRLWRDRRVHVYTALVEMISGDPEVIQAALDDARPWMSEAERHQLPVLGEWVGRVDRLLGRMLESGRPDMAFLMEAVGLLTSPELQARLDEELLIGSVSMHQRFIADTFAALTGRGGLSAILSNLWFHRYDTIIQQLGRAIEVNPNPILRFCRALVGTLADSEDYEAIAADYAAAADELDLIPNLSLYSRLGVLKCRMRIWDGRRDTETAYRVVDAIEDLERRPAAPTWLLETLARDADIVGAFDLSRSLLFRMQRAQPDDLGTLRLRVEMETHASSWLAARNALESLLDRLPTTSAERATCLEQMTHVEAQLRFEVGPPPDAASAPLEEGL